MIGRYVHVGDGWVLMTDSGACIGRLVDIPRQIHEIKHQSYHGPTGWFKLDSQKYQTKTVDYKFGA